MIAGVTGVTRSGGMELSLPVRTAAPTPEREAPLSPTSSADAQRPSQTAVAASGSSGGSGSSTREESSPPEEHNEATAASARYLAELLTSRVLGTQSPSPRPEHISPERLAALINYLEASSTSLSAGLPGGAGAVADAKKSVDVTG